ncbi:MAG: hypothetical protein ACLFP7_03455 [Thiohalospira sp.]
MSASDEILLITVAGGQPAFDAALRGGLEARGIAFREADLDAGTDAVLDALEAGARPMILKPAAE